MDQYDQLLVENKKFYSDGTQFGPLNCGYLPEHVKQAVLGMDLWMVDLGRAVQGARWLDKHAPSDWRLQMIRIVDGNVQSMVRLCRDDENPAALAFRRIKELQRADGRVSWAMVEQKFFARPVIGSVIYRPVHRPEELGFLEQEHRFGDTVINANIDGHFLDVAWAKVLESYDWQPQPVASYTKAA